MAEINELVARHFHIDRSNRTAQEIACSLDIGLGNAGRMVMSLRDQVVHGQPGCGSGKIDVDEVAAGLDALLSLMGNLGLLLDQIGEHAVEDVGSPAHQAQAA